MPIHTHIIHKPQPRYRRIHIKHETSARYTTTSLPPRPLIPADDSEKGHGRLASALHAGRGIGAEARAPERRRTARPGPEGVEINVLVRPAALFRVQAGSPRGVEGREVEDIAEGNRAREGGVEGYVRGIADRRLWRSDRDGWLLGWRMVLSVVWV